MLTVFFITALVVFLYFNTLFFIALARKDNSIVDIGWGIGFVLIAWFVMLVFGDINLRQIITTALVTAWGVRLAMHIYLRNRGKDEDWRYRQWREQWGKWFIPRSYFQVFMLQALLMMIVAIPVIHINAAPSIGNQWLILSGILLWISGFFTEVLADYHLSQHINNPKLKGLLTSGVWSVSRHPNYLGEAMQWWGIGLISIASSPGLVFYENGCGLWTLIGPIAITLLVRYVSGVPLLEKKYTGDKEFEKYKQTTPVFVPWPKWWFK